METLIPALYYYRDVYGNEIDLIVESDEFYIQEIKNYES